MRIAISGVPGTGKTTLSKAIAEKLNLNFYNLNSLAKNYKINDVPILNTFDFDIDKLFNDLEKELKNKDNYIIESHFSHLINPDYIDILIILNKDIKQLNEIYKERDYNKKKIRDNLDSEIFNICYYEAIENNFPENKIICYENNKNIEETLKDIIKIIKNTLNK